MSKEVEALKRIVNEISNYKLHGLGDENWLGIQDIMQDIDILEKALTPPTADQLCEELEEYFYRCVGKACPCLKYDKDTKKFIYIDNLIGDVYELVTLEKHGYIHFATSLPPRLIKRIAMFYEKEGKE